MEIKDGSGTSQKAKVDVNNRLHTKASTEDNKLSSIRDGESFYTQTPSSLTFTNDSTSWIYYFKNNSNRNIIMGDITISIGQSTGGSGSFKADFKLNPTGGTLISGGTAIVPLNQNLSSDNVLDATILSGVQGSTITGGVGDATVYGDSSRFTLPFEIILPKGFSIAFGVTPFSGNTSMEAQVFTTVRLEPVE